MSTHLVVLAIESEPADYTDPGDWNWVEILDSPLPVGVVLSVEANDDWTVEQNILQLSSMLKNQVTKEA